MEKIKNTGSVNPWLQIPAADYENHMFEVGQSQLLSQLTKEHLEKYQPKRFALLGCATGNGLEHIDVKQTESVVAIDINPEFVQQTKIRFENSIPDLQAICMDIRKEAFSFGEVDMVFAGLILEYVQPENLLLKIINVLNTGGILAIVIQQSNHGSFVTKTKYASLQSLGKISNEVEEKNIHQFLHQNKMNLLKRREISMHDQKKFIALTYQLSS